jgi:RNA polymerase sigma-70 factor, ECF subfamily
MVENETACALLQRCAGGDETAFTELYDRLFARLRQLAHRIVQSRELAEDVAQEVFVWVWSHASRFDPTRGSGINWLLQITHARAVDAVRSTVSTRQRDERYAREAEPIRSAVDPAARVQLREDVSWLWSQVDALPDSQRTALTLATLHELTRGEIAEILQIPVGTASWRIFRAIEVLRAAAEIDGVA